MRRTRLAAACVLTLAAVLCGAACGKRGAPIPPNVRIPAAVETMTLARLGNDVYITLAVPATNIDESMPIDIDRVDVYAYTGRTAPPMARFADLGAVVASIPVVSPPRPDAGAPSSSASDPSKGARPGATVTVVDSLTGDELEQGRVYVDPRPAPAGVGVPAESQGPLHRFYRAIPFSVRGRPGPPGAQAELALTTLPDPPSGVRVGYDATAISVTWEPSGGLLGFLLDRTLPPESTPFVASAVAPASGASQSAPEAATASGPTTYNVYRELAPDGFELASAGRVPPWASSIPEPVNRTALTTTSTTDQLVMGRRHCYTVRAERSKVMSESSPPTCITPLDVFPPSAPTGLAAVPSEGGISLIWEPNGEQDLGGYLVLRREAGDATLRQLTPAPVLETRYRDADVQPGRRYIYSVVAVDAQVPLPNVSAESERVEESAQ